MKPNKVLWVSELAKRKLKTQASAKGLTLKAYLEQLSENAEQEDKKIKKFSGGFF